jgi:hypothetical protein
MSKTQVPNGMDIPIDPFLYRPLQVHLCIKIFHLFTLLLSLRCLTANNIQQIIVIKCIVFGGRENSSREGLYLNLLENNPRI